MLLLEDGTTFTGRSFGADGESVGEVVFNTGMTGYQEIVTDPSYKGQIVTMTCPLIGNVGVNTDDDESPRPWLSGLIVREYIDTPSNWRATASLSALLVQHGVVAIDGIDTRALTRKIRQAGAMQGILSTQRSNVGDVAALRSTLTAAPTLVGRDLVREVTCAVPQVWSTGAGPHVVVYDFGVKQNILRRLSDLSCRVTVVPASTTAAAALALQPDGLLFSNGPGDPEALPYAITAAERLIGKVPLFGICLGHQILGLALGGKCIKLKFGHHGCNHPVREVESGRVQITSQNHGFAIDFSGISDSVDVTHISLNDQTPEGMRHRTLPVSSVQFHPEAAPGPHDAHGLLDGFVAGLSCAAQNNDSKIALYSGLRLDK